MQTNEANMLRFKESPTNPAIKVSDNRQHSKANFGDSKYMSLQQAENFSTLTASEFGSVNEPCFYHVAILII